MPTFPPLLFGQRLGRGYGGEGAGRIDWGGELQHEPDAAGVPEGDRRRAGGGGEPQSSQRGEGGRAVRDSAGRRRLPSNPGGPDDRRGLHWYAALRPQGD